MGVGRLAETRWPVRGARGHESRETRDPGICPGGKRLVSRLMTGAADERTSSSVAGLGLGARNPFAPGGASAAYASMEQCAANERSDQWVLEGGRVMGASRSRGQSGGTAAAERVEVSLSEPLLDCAAAAALLNVRVSWVRDAARLGQLPCLRVGRHLRFTRPMLEEWLTGQFARAPAAGRSYPRPARAGGGPGRGVFRGSTQAALLASLAEKPQNREGAD
ncbi:MAG: helix-turn-helix domain-containing protein [Solirubrobacteraceae bacterium]